MNKVLRELLHLRCGDYGTIKQFNDRLDIIEQEFKRLEKLEIMYSNCVIETTKQQKALEIITKMISIRYFVEEWYTEKLISREEYDLLKEVFL